MVPGQVYSLRGFPRCRLVYVASGFKTITKTGAYPYRDKEESGKRLLCLQTFIGGTGEAALVEEAQEYATIENFAASRAGLTNFDIFMGGSSTVEGHVVPEGWYWVGVPLNQIVEVVE